MSIVEHLDSYDNGKLMYISYVPNGKVDVIRTHGMSLKSAIDLVCQEGGFSIKQYYEYLEILKGCKDGTNKNINLYSNG